MADFDEIYEVEQVLARRKNKQGFIEYLIRWKGFNSDWDTWEPLSGLGAALDVIEEFNSREALGKLALSLETNAANMPGTRRSSSSTNSPVCNGPALVNGTTEQSETSPSKNPPSKRNRKESLLAEMFPQRSLSNTPEKLSKTGSISEGLKSKNSPQKVTQTPDLDSKVVKNTPPKPKTKKSKSDSEPEIKPAKNMSKLKKTKSEPVPGTSKETLTKGKKVQKTDSENVTGSPSRKKKKKNEEDKQEVDDDIEPKKASSNQKGRRSAVKCASPSTIKEKTTSQARKAKKDLEIKESEVNNEPKAVTKVKKKAAQRKGKEEDEIKEEKSGTKKQTKSKASTKTGAQQTKKKVVSKKIKSGQATTAVKTAKKLKEIAKKGGVSKKATQTKAKTPGKKVDRASKPKVTTSKRKTTPISLEPNPPASKRKTPPRATEPIIPSPKKKTPPRATEATPEAESDITVKKQSKNVKTNLQTMYQKLGENSNLAILAFDMNGRKEQSRSISESKDDIAEEIISKCPNAQELTEKKTLRGRKNSAAKNMINQPNLAKLDTQKSGVNGVNIVTKTSKVAKKFASQTPPGRNIKGTKDSTSKKESPKGNKTAKTRTAKNKSVSKETSGQTVVDSLDSSDDDDILYSLNEDAAAESVIPRLLVDTGSSKESTPDPEISFPRSPSRSPARSPAMSPSSPTSPGRKMLLKNSMKPKTKLAKTVPCLPEASPSSPPKSPLYYSPEATPYKTPPSSPTSMEAAHTSPASQPRTSQSANNSTLYLSDLPPIPVIPIMPSSPASAAASFKLINHVPLKPPTETRGIKRKQIDSDDEDEPVERRLSVRQSESAFRYKEIVVKKCQGYSQIWLFTNTKIKNSLNPKVLQELCQALHNAKYDDSRLVMLSGSGSVFCSGVDLHYLLSDDRKITSRKLADALRDFVNVVISFPKPIIAAVNGPAIGLGVTLLPLCDIIYASDKASFYCPYARLSQTPEACASHTFPTVMGMAMANELLLAGRKVTAIEAYQIGLVSQVFWPTSMMQEVIPRLQNMAQFSAKAMEASKLLIRSANKTKLEFTNEGECQMLAERWATSECTRAIKAYLDDELDILI